MNSGRPESQHRSRFGGPDAAEHGDELRAPGGIVVVMAIPMDTGGDGGVDETVFCKKKQIFHQYKKSGIKITHKSKEPKKCTITILLIEKSILC